MKTAELGTVCHGTLRQRDLIEAFADQLEHLGYKGLLVNEAYKWLDAEELIDGISEPDYVSAHVQAGDGILDELFDALDECAPANCYFGASENDGADFGFWVNHDYEPTDDEIANGPGREGGVKYSTEPTKMR